MTGLKPAKILHTRLFDISMNTVQNLLTIIALMLATFIVIKFFIGFVFYALISAVIAAVVVEFFSGLHRRDDWAGD